MYDVNPSIVLIDSLRSHAAMLLTHREFQKAFLHSGELFTRHVEEHNEPHPVLMFFPRRH